MNKHYPYKIIILILSGLIILQAIFLIIFLRQKRAPKIAPIVKGKIAIVLDDWGYNLNNLALAQELRYPITMSVLPNLAYSRLLAEELHKHGFEIILHLPMEPQEKIRLEEDTITNLMGEPTIRDILFKDLADIPFVRGVSNHMGSSATRNLKTMEKIFKELKKRKLYFLDSLVTSESVCAKLAKRQHLAFAKRDVFLDNVENPQYILTQILKLKNRAIAKGSSIGIGHDRKMTLEVLKEIMPRLEKEGFKFVFVSDLVK
jgi:polysaccharide deacetylase 2 family uncharacterized protein YibQ